MFRIAFSLIALGILVSPSTADEPKKEKPAVELGGSIADESLQKESPANGVVASQKEWEKLAKAWGIKDAPKVDFGKHLLAVGTWKGSSFNITPMVNDGDLTVSAGGTKDLRPGFRWKIVSVPREGVKTVQGKPLKE